MPARRDTKLAPSTRFWGAALRFVAGLALRDRFLPSMTAEGESFHARWKPPITAPDQDRLRQLARAMPPVARAITSADAKTPPEDDPAVLLSSFVGWLMDVLPRAASSSARLPTSRLRDVNKHIASGLVKTRGSGDHGFRSHRLKPCRLDQRLLRRTLQPVSELSPARVGLLRAEGCGYPRCVSNLAGYEPFAETATPAPARVIRSRSGKATPIAGQGAISATLDA
jgi:hypothetical protein